MAFRGHRQTWHRYSSVQSALTMHCHQSCSARVATLYAPTADQSCSSVQPAGEHLVSIQSLCSVLLFSNLSSLMCLKIIDSIIL